MKLHLDVAIDKVPKLSFDVHMQDMLRKWDDIYERNKDMFDQTKENAPKPLGAQAVAEPGHNYVTEVNLVSKGRSR